MGELFGRTSKIFSGTSSFGRTRSHRQPSAASTSPTGVARHANHDGVREQCANTPRGFDPSMRAIPTSISTTAGRRVCAS